MKRTFLILGATAFLFAACNNENTAGESTDEDSASKMDNTAEKPWVPVDSATAEKNWMAYMQPGQPHEMLAKANGNWTVETTMWMAPGAPPMTSTGTATNKMVMGGRYQVSNFSGNMMGMPFEGMSLVGYDNAKKVFISTWIDNMGTGIAKFEGSWDDATKSITFKGKMVDPTRNEECDMREVFTMVDDNTQRMEMYGPDPATGKEFKSMEITFTRKK